MLAHNQIKRFDQLIVYSSQIINHVELNYMTMEHEALTMVYALHKVRHYLLGNLFVFLVDHTIVIYLVNKPQVSRCITQWLFLCLEYDLKVIYKPTKSHNVVDALSIFPNQDLKRLKKFTCFNLNFLFI